MAEELIAFAFKQEMLAKSKQFWNGNPEVAAEVTALATIAGRKH